jgi:hypothetical protein
MCLFLKDVFVADVLPLFLARGVRMCWRRDKEQTYTLIPSVIEGSYAQVESDAECESAGKDSRHEDTCETSGLIRGTKIRKRGHVLLRLKRVLYREVEIYGQ